MQKNVILKFENNNIEILKNNYCYGYVWGFVIKLINIQERKNNYEFDSDGKVLIVHHCFSKFFKLEMSYKTIVPILDILMEKKSEEGEIGTKDGLKEAKEWSENDIPCVGLIVKNSSMNKEEYASLREDKKRKEMEEAINMGTKLADLGTLHNLESRTKAALEKNINQNDSEKTIELDQGSFLNKKNFTKEAYIEQWKKWTNDIKMLCNTSEDYQKLKDLEIWVDGLASKSFDNMYQEQQNKLNEVR